MTCRSSHAGSSRSPQIFRVYKTLASPDLQCGHRAVVVAGEARQRCYRKETSVKKVLVSEQMEQHFKGFLAFPTHCKSLGSFLTPADGIQRHWQVHPSCPDDTVCVLRPGLCMSSPARSQHHLERFIVRPRSKGQIFDVGWTVRPLALTPADVLSRPTIHVC